MMLKRRKIDEIKSARELLRIDSRYGKVQNFKRNMLIGIIAIFLVLYTLAILFLMDKKIDDEQIAFIFASLIIFILVVIVVRKSAQTRGSTFLITEKGILLGSDIVEYWADIYGYGWETLKGFTRLSTSSKGEGTCLIIFNKGLFQRNILRWTSHSVLAQYGIFFTPEQIQEAEMIFNQHGIKKNKDFTYVKATNKNGTKINPNYVLSLQILLWVVIPTSALILLKILRILYLNVYALLIYLVVMDTVLIILLIWLWRKSRRGNEK